MPKDRPSELLDEFSAVTSAAPRPESPARRPAMANRFPVATLTGASLVIVAVAVAAIVFGRSGPGPAVGASNSPIAPTARGPAPSEGIAAASPRRTIGPCDPAMLSAHVTLWEGAAGSRIAHVSLTNRATVDCVLDDLSRPMLVGADGTVLINGKESTTSRGLLLAPGKVVTTLVEASNYCGAPPVAPVSVAFVFADDREIVAQPVGPTDATVPPCNGAGAAAAIAMHPWAS